MFLFSIIFSLSTLTFTVGQFFGGSKAADVKNRKRPMLKQPMLLKAADVA